MKHAKKPTLKQKKLMVKNRYKAENWLVLTENNICMKLINKVSGNIRTINKC